MATSLKMGYMPTPEYVSSDGTDHNRPSSNSNMFGGTNTLNSAFEMIDIYDGSKHNFRQTINGSDRKAANMDHAWSSASSSNYAYFGAKIKMENYHTQHIGMNQYTHSNAQIKANEMYWCAGCSAVYFMYNWPKDDDLNYWTNSPNGISKFMFHYWNHKNNTSFSHLGEVVDCSPSDKYMWITHAGEYDAKTSDTKWHRATFQVAKSTPRGQIKDNGYFLIGISIETKYQQRGGQSHHRGWRMKNLTPVFPSYGSKVRQILTGLNAIDSKKHRIDYH